MRPRAVGVAHRHALVAEGLAAGLAGFPELAPVTVTTRALDLVDTAARLDTAAVDRYLPGAEEAASRLRAHGVRVVFIGDAGEEDLGMWVSPSAGIAALASAVAPGLRRREREARLTAREREVLELVARGMIGKQVARHLGISPKTVERHKAHIFAKLGVPNQAAAVSVAMSANGGESPWSPSTI